MTSEKGMLNNYTIKEGGLFHLLAYSIYNNINNNNNMTISTYNWIYSQSLQYV